MMQDDSSNKTSYERCILSGFTLELTPEDLENLRKPQQCEAKRRARHIAVLENIYSGLNKKSSGLL